MKRVLILTLCSCLCLSCCACGQQDSAPIGDPAGPEVQIQAEPQSVPVTPAPESVIPQPPAPETAVPTVSGEQDSYNRTWGEMQNADFWIALADDPQAIRMTPEEIVEYNRAITLLYDTDVENLSGWPETLTMAKLLDLLNHYGPTPDSGYYTPDGLITSQQRTAIGENRNASAVQTENPVRYGFVVNNTILRTFPSAIPLYDSSHDEEYDKAAETAFKIWEPLLVLHTSADGEWFLVRAYDYLGWLPVTDVGLCDRTSWDELCTALTENQLTVTAARLPLDGSFTQPRLDGTVLKMGTRLPLVADAASCDNAIADNCHIVQMPLRADDGSLEVVTARIPLQEDVCVGNLPYTTEAILRQVFKLLGHRYGWGGTADGWDCSSICQDVFRTVGLDLPRNSSRQRRIPGCMDVKDTTDQHKTDALSTLLPGAMLELPGHQTMYIGRFEGEDYVIHATFGVYDGQGQLYKANSVIVSSVQAFRSNGKTLLQNFRGFSMPATLSQ